MDEGDTKANKGETTVGCALAAGHRPAVPSIDGPAAAATRSVRGSIRRFWIGSAWKLVLVPAVSAPLVDIPVHIAQAPGAAAAALPNNPATANSEYAAANTDLYGVLGAEARKTAATPKLAEQEQLPMDFSAAYAAHSTD